MGRKHGLEEENRQERAVKKALDFLVPTSFASFTASFCILLRMFSVHPYTDNSHDMQ